MTENICIGAKTKEPFMRKCVKDGKKVSQVYCEMHCPDGMRKARRISYEEE